MFDKSRIDDLPVHPTRDETKPSAINGLKVVDFTHFIAGPLATMILADFGADVIKIEPPLKGDDFRYYPPHDPAMPAQGGPFLWTNRNKRSVAIDVKTPDGVQIVLDLIAQADVMIENFSSGVMSRFGLGYEQCAAINPRLIYCSVSAYGREGPYADRLGFDPVAQAESGFISMNGYPDRPGVRSSSSVMDISTAMMASNAILLALLARERTGKGQQLEVALFDTAILMTGFASMQQLLTGKDPQRHGNTSLDTCPTGLFATSDHPFYLICGNDKIFQRLVTEVLDRPDIAKNPIFVKAADRIKNRELLFKMLGEEFSLRPWSHWQQKLRSAAVPHGEVRTLGEALHSGEARSRGLVNRIPHQVVGWIPNVGSPIRLSDTPAVTPRAAPAVGQHTDEVLRSVLGYDEGRILSLRQAGVLGPSHKEKA